LIFNEEHKDHKKLNPFLGLFWIWSWSL